MRSVKTKEEIEAMQCAADIAGTAFNKLLGFILEGRTEHDVAH